MLSAPLRSAKDSWLVFPGLTSDVRLLRRRQVMQVSAEMRRSSAQDEQTEDWSTTPDPGSVAEFYRDSVIFMTGGTGFMGLVLLEKLLRACSVRKIYLLLRSKKGKEVQERFSTILANPLFDTLKSMNPNVEEKLYAIEGDCSLPDLGLKPADRQTLIQEVNVVFHMAATVRFDESLRKAAVINVRATKDVLQLAKQILNFKAMIHVSTAYSHCYREDIEEEFYDPPLSAEKLWNLLEAVDDKVLQKMEHMIVGKWPNTYSYTKAIAEDLIRTEGKDLAVGIVRPSMVITTAREPVSGWVNNLNGPSGVVFGAGLGVLRTLQCDGNCIADIVPADMVINATLVAAWDVARRKNAKRLNNFTNGTKLPEDSKQSGIPIYNYVSSSQNPINWDHFMEINEIGRNYGSKHVQWYYCLFLTRYKLIHRVQKLLLHLLPALILDLITRLIGKEPMMLKTYKKIHKFSDVLAYFTLRDWKFSNLHVQQMWKLLSKKDQEIFPFNIADIQWEEAVRELIPGLRIYILREPKESLHTTQKAYKRLKVAHYCLVTCLWLLFIRFLWWVYCIIV